MSSTRVTVGGLFGAGPEGLSSDQLPDAALTQVYAQMQEQMQDKAGAAWTMVQGNSISTWPGCSTSTWSALLVDGWNKSRELRKYRDEAAYPPDEVIVAALSKHKLESKHTPHLELVVADRPVGRLHFQIDLALVIDGAQLTIQAGPHHAHRHREDVRLRHHPVRGRDRGAEGTEAGRAARPYRPRGRDPDPRVNSQVTIHNSQFTNGVTELQFRPGFVT